MKTKKILITALLTIFFFPSAFGWSALEHKIIAEIAYENTSYKAKHFINKLTKTIDRKYSPPARLYYAAIWPDLLTHQHGITAFRNWHFINHPYSPDKTPTQPYLRQNNVAWAIEQAQHVLTSNKSNRIEKSLALRFLIHFVGDSHQPLHCFELYSKQHPNGDGGGNLFKINTMYANNLHSFWDHAVGAFDKYIGKHVSIKTIKQLTYQIEKNHPQSSLKKEMKNLSPNLWAIESYKIAKNFAYKNIKENSAPSQTYIKKGRKIAKKRIALAGYRLAKLLQNIANN